VELSALTPITAYVVLSDVFYPGWTATLDDQPAQLYPANFAFRAVLVPPGEHRVTFTFEPLVWRAGIGIGAITLLGLIGYAVCILARGGVKLKIPSRWTPGNHIVLRGVWRGNLWFALPMTVVQDSPDLIALYWRAGTCGKATGKRPTPRDLMSLEKVALVDYVWKETDVLMLAMPGAAHSVYVMWDAGHIRFRCWYVNLEEPLRRTPLGFDTMDHLLDIVIRPNGTEWRWKDEDEFQQAEAIGLYSAEEVRAIRAEGERVLDRLRAGQSPFCDHWESWLPPAGWKIPALPANWDDLAASQ
jgi:hypothetical protein